MERLTNKEGADFYARLELTRENRNFLLDIKNTIHLIEESGVWIEEDPVWQSVTRLEIQLGWCDLARGTLKRVVDPIEAIGLRCNLLMAQYTMGEDYVSDLKKAKVVANRMGGALGALYLMKLAGVEQKIGIDPGSSINKARRMASADMDGWEMFVEEELKLGLYEDVSVDLYLIEREDDKYIASFLAKSAIISLLKKDGSVYVKESINSAEAMADNMKPSMDRINLLIYIAEAKHGAGLEYMDLILKAFTEMNMSVDGEDGLGDMLDNLKWVENFPETIFQKIKSFALKNGCSDLLVKVIEFGVKQGFDVKKLIEQHIEKVRKSSSLSDLIFSLLEVAPFLKACGYNMDIFWDDIKRKAKRAVGEKTIFESDDNSDVWSAIVQTEAEMGLRRQAIADFERIKQEENQIEAKIKIIEASIGSCLSLSEMAKYSGLLI
jgi:hypothetical protein